MKTRLFTISEDDLAALEAELPRAMDASPDCCNDPINRKRWEMIKSIIANVRWSYGPPLETHRIDG